jgi:broad specificity phosphatase PhoE
MKRRDALLVIPLLAGAASARADDARALDALRAGGCAVLMRHAKTDPGIGDPPGFRLGDCSTQRNLSPAGRAQAKNFGEMLRERGVRIDEVRSSQWCRCIETARLAFPALPVQPFEALNSFFDDRRTEPQQTAAVRRYLATLGARNALLVTHMVNISALTGGFSAMGDALVVREMSGSALRVFGRLRVD